MPRTIRPPDATLLRISSLAREGREAEVFLRRDLEEKVQLALEAHHRELGVAVATARGKNYAVSELARAITPPGRSPNRAKVYALLEEFPTLAQPDSPEAFPFRWEPRTLRTARGHQVFYDLVAEFANFGPNRLMGTYRWSVIAGELEPVYNRDVEDWQETGMPYPVGEVYVSALNDWMAMNPQPASEVVDGGDLDEPTVDWTSL